MLPLELSDIGKDILSEMNPKNIVDSAGAWDNPDFVTWFYDRVANREGMDGVKTKDGAITFSDIGERHQPYRKVDFATERMAEPPEPPTENVDVSVDEAFALLPEEEEAITKAIETGTLSDVDREMLTTAETAQSNVPKYQQALLAAIDCLD